VLGCYYLTMVKDGAKGSGKMFASIDEALLAYDKGLIDIQAPIFVRMTGTVYGESDRPVRMLSPDEDGDAAYAARDDHWTNRVATMNLLPNLALPQPPGRHKKGLK
jgi:hypothetical protein